MRKSTCQKLEIQKCAMHPQWSSLLFLLPLIFVGSRADVCTGQWESLEGGGKMVVKGSFSTKPSRPFVIDFHHFEQLGMFCHPERSVQKTTTPSFYCLLPSSPLSVSFGPGAPQDLAQRITSLSR